MKHSPYIILALAALSSAVNSSPIFESSNVTLQLETRCTTSYPAHICSKLIITSNTNHNHSRNPCQHEAVCAICGCSLLQRKYRPRWFSRHLQQQCLRFCLSNQLCIPRVRGARSSYLDQLTNFQDRYDQSEASGFIGIDSSRSLIIVSYAGSDNFDNYIAE
jgi:hypothetical protein